MQAGRGRLPPGLLTRVKAAKTSAAAAGAAGDGPRSLADYKRSSKRDKAGSMQRILVRGGEGAEV